MTTSTSPSGSSPTRPPLRRGRTVLAALALAAGVASASGLPSPHPQGDTGARPAESSSRAELAEYFLSVETILFTRSDQSGATAREYIAASRDTAWAQYLAASRLKVPVEARVPHRMLLQALRTNAYGARRAAQLTPPSAPKTDETIARYSHAVPDVGYARDDTSQAACDLKRLADTLGQSLQVLGFCGLESGPRPAPKTLGSPTAPVNDIYLLQDVAYDPDTGQARPNVDGFQYSTVYAKAGKPIRIRFDNRNPPPFVFNIAIYDNASGNERVTEAQRVAKSDAYSGVRVHTVTVTLRPGLYTYVDEVHPLAMRGRLIVVP